MPACIFNYPKKYYIHTIIYNYNFELGKQVLTKCDCDCADFVTIQQNFVQTKQQTTMCDKV